MKKIFSLVLSLALAMSCAVTLSACGESAVYDTNYSYDDTHHWFSLISGNGDDKKGVEEHVNEKGKCKCGKYFECDELVYRLNEDGTGLICFGAASDDEYAEIDEIRDYDSFYTLSNRWKHVEVPARKVYNGVEYPVVTLAYGAFKTENLLSIKLNEGLLELEKQCFASLGGVKEITIPNSVTEIAGSQFYQNNAIERVVFGSGMTYMGTYMFYQCYNLKYVKLSENLQTMQHTAFGYCTSLEYLVLPASLQTMYVHVYGVPTQPEEYNYSPFKGCSTELKIYLEHLTVPTTFGDDGENWNVCSATVYMGNEWEYNADGVPTPKN